MEGLPSPSHVDSKVAPKSFGRNYGESSDDQRSPLSAAKAAVSSHASTSTTSLESSTSSSSGRSNVPNYQYITQGKHTVPHKVRSGENLAVAGTAAAPQSVDAPGDSSTSGSSSSVYPLNTDTVTSGDETAQTELEVSVGGSSTPSNQLEESGATLEQIDAENEDAHRENYQTSKEFT